MGRRAEFVVLASLWVAALVLLNGVAAEGECGKVRCGMGACAESGDYAFGFACQCKPGWSRYHLGSVQFPFLPCVIPNCTINYKCQDDGPSPPPAPSPPAGLPPLTNFSIFDPCLMQYCGDGGACEKASDFAHRCRCRDGYTNLLNDTSYPCYRQCSLGSDCKGLGIDVINGSTPSMSPPAPFSFTVKRSGAGAAAVPAGGLLDLLLLISFLWLQAI
ncbi:hypothetical protein SEVIR_8G174900v4 [Setaria viridis]|uniref:EGF-like domain-containing protein n=1 Tax=Setaria viridis TaxID=4556 RepID=A0A4U6TK60_SETVI|nr:uncharacterized protein LOC117866441 [Setaria viridis]TKW01365.1 hypothetical protein SEVIR_8G174900v2 [Setaria viridis]